MVSMTFLFSSFLMAQEPNGDVFTNNKNTVEIEDKEESLSNTYEDEVIAENESLSTYPIRIINGAKWLNMSEDFVYMCWEIMEGLYIRDYDKLDASIEKAEKLYPNTGVGATGTVLKWQMKMLENFDFAYENQYRNAYKITVHELEEALEKEGNEAWERFLIGAVVGIDAIHLLRKEEYFSAITQGFGAIGHIEKAKELAPEFVDADLGDGLWLYWRSLIAMNIPGFSSFADKRAEGIQLMQNAEQKSVFLRPASSHALTYTWLEERKMKRAESTAVRLQKQYPKNIINLQLLGRIYMYENQFAKSEQTFKKVILIDSKNQRVHYYLGRLYLRWRKNDLAYKHLYRYLQYSLSDMHKGYAFYYLGHVYARDKEYVKAEDAYNQAYKYAKIKQAKNRAKSMKSKQSETSK